jgi:D-xylulose reductase
MSASGGARAESLVLHAERRPLPGVADPGPHQLYRNPRLAVETRELGALAPDALRVDLLYAGICGTDLHVAQCDPATGYVRSSAPLSVGPEGRVLGHEGVGRVVEVGAGVGHLRRGDLVTFESILRCHRCDPCRRGALNQCESARLLGMEHDGLFATRADVPALLAHPVDDLADRPGGLIAASCIEPAACVLVAAAACRVGPGDAIVIFGAGPLGLFAAMACRLVFGASAIHVVEPVAFRRALAARWADRCSDVEEFFADPPALRADVVIETSGALAHVDRVLDRVAPNGRIALLARSGEPLALSRVDRLISNAVTIVGSRGHLGGAFADVLRLIRAGRLPLHEGVTAVVDGVRGLEKCLADPAFVTQHNGKVVARVNEAGER